MQGNSGRCFWIFSPTLPYRLLPGAVSPSFALLLCFTAPTVRLSLGDGLKTMHTILLPFFIFALVSISLVVGVANSDSHSLALRKRTVPLDDYPLHQPSAFISSGEQDEALQLLDIVLLASVDGKFHALNRTSGHTLWSMASSSTAETPSTLGPLVRTAHPAQTPSSSGTDEDELEQEVYIIEPQSGDIYVMTSPTAPLQRLAFSMPELVNMSPFDFSLSEHGDKRVFVGSKETSMFTLELETGVVKEVNAECPWDPFEDLKDAWEDDGEIDLDELENPVVKDSTEISIGRTGSYPRLPICAPNN